MSPDLRVIVQPSARDALAEAWRLSPSIVVAGSIFLLGEVLKVLSVPSELPSS